MAIFKKKRTIVDVYDHKTGLNTNVDRPYLILLIPSGQEENTSGEFVAIKGRKEAYKYCSEYVLSGGYDIVRSQILSDGINFGKEVSLYTFLRLCIDHYKYDEEDQLEVLNRLSIESYIEPDSLSYESLARFYNAECSQSSK